MDTSADTLIVGTTSTGVRRAYLMEWKYAESYRADVSMMNATRQSRYEALYSADDSCFSGGAPLEELLYDPIYQIMRMGLLGERERVRRGLLIPLDPWIEESRRFLEMYRLLTGFPETNPAAVHHHRVAEYGPPCPRCTKPYRTPRARFCAACGNGMEDDNVILGRG